MQHIHLYRNVRRTYDNGHPCDLFQLENNIYDYQRTEHFSRTDGAVHPKIPYGALVIFLQLSGVIGTTLTGALSQAFRLQSVLIFMQFGFILSTVFFMISLLFYRSDFNRSRQE